MKNLLFSLIAILVMASASAQNDQTVQKMHELNVALSKDSTVKVVSIAKKAGPAFVQKKPASKKQTTAANGPAKAKTTKINGVEVFITSYGLHLPGDMFPDPNTGEELVVDDYGNVLKTGKMWKQAPNPANNTGTATAGVTVVSSTPKLDDMYDVLDDGRIVAAGPVRVEPAGGGATASTNSGGVPAGLYELDPSKDYYYTDPATGTPTLVDKPMMAQTVRRNQVLTNGKDVQLLERGREEHRADDNYGLSTNPESEHMPDPRVVAADHSGDMFTSWFGSGGNGLMGGGSVLGAGGGVIVGGGASVGFGNGQVCNAGDYNPNPIGWEAWNNRQAATFGGVWHW